MRVRLTILGSGTSHGVPMIGCECAVCASDDPRDTRARPSALFSYNDYNVLIDTAPELRIQCLANNVTRVHAILFTHAHADHIVGLDDVHRFNWLQDGPIPVYAGAPTLERLRTMFDYAFDDDADYPSRKPSLKAFELTGPVELFGRRVIPIPYMHGPLPVLGFRIGDSAYCPDCSFIPDESLSLLEDLDVLVLDGLRRRPHPTHFNIAQAVEWARRIGARRTYFTHIAHELGHAATNAELPRGMQLAYDGLVCDSE